jgi:hypothetical protein
MSIALIRQSLRRMPREKKLLLARSVNQKRRRANDPLKLYREKYGKDPELWVDEFVDIRPTRHQIKIFRAIKNRLAEGKAVRLAAYGVRGWGKSCTLALLSLWVISTSAECKATSTAGAWHQLINYYWPEVSKWSGRTNWAKVGKKPVVLVHSAKFTDQSFLASVSPDDPGKMEGAHAGPGEGRVAYFFDEAKIIPKDRWTAVEGAFSTPGQHLWFAFSTPGEPSGTFYSICSGQGGADWIVIKVTLREAIREGQVSLSWARQMRKDYGKDSPAYHQHVWGIFAKDSDDAIIPLSWVEAAINRWYAWRDAGCTREGLHEIGADTSGQGRDKTIFAHRYSKVITHLDKFGKSRPMEVAGQLLNEMRSDGASVKIDVNFGEGAATANRLSEFTDVADRVIPVHAAKSTDKCDRSGHMQFANVRAWMWWNMREMLDPANEENICLPPDDELKGDLTAPKRKPRSDGRILIEPKDDIKKRIGRSTDAGDAVCQVFLPIESSGDYTAWL